MNTPQSALGQHRLRPEVVELQTVEPRTAEYLTAFPEVQNPFPRRATLEFSQVERGFAPPPEGEARDRQKTWKKTRVLVWGRPCDPPA